MPASLDGLLVVAIASRALFDFEQENRVFDPADDGPYRELQLSRLDVPAPGGVAYPLVKKLLEFNTPDQPRVEVVILSRNDPVSGLRIFRSAEAARLALTRGVFTRGRSPYRYLKPLQADLFLSANEEDVRSALASGFAAARVYPESARAAESHPGEVRIAFDGDAVLFSDEAEIVYRRDGLKAFENHEAEKAARPLEPGPFKPFLEALHRLQALAGHEVGMRIRTALVTARSAPAHERVIRTLRAWDVRLDESLFLGGMDKTEFLRAFGADVFFDDQPLHCERAAAHLAAGHVPHGIVNLER